MLKTLRTIHKWAGLVLALPLILQCITGIILAADPLFSPTDVAIDLARVPAVFAAAQAAVPEGSMPRRYQDAGAAGTLVDFTNADTPQVTRQVSVDTATQHVSGVRILGHGLYGWAHEWHETLLLGPFGRSICGWCGIGLFLLGITGIPIWWPSPTRWKAALTISRRAHGWRLFRELHGAFGAWMLGLLLLQSLSGASMAFPQTARTLLRLPAQQHGGGHHAHADDAPAPDLAAVVAAATKAAPNASLRQIRFANGGGAAMNLLLLPNGALDGAPMIMVSVDAASGRVLSVQDPRTGRLWLLGWLRALHSGGGLSIAWRLAICLLGVAMPLLPVTGVLMWLRRKPKRLVAVTGETQAC